MELQQEHRIKIAEACGWVKIGEYSGLPGLYGHKVNYPFGPLCKVPKFTESLDAMYEAEKVLTDEQHTEFRKTLSSIIMGPINGVRLMNAVQYRAWFSATAAQRAEAFLKTKGLWEKDKNDTTAKVSN